MRQWGCSLALGLLATLLAITSAWSHAILIGSEPTDRAVVAAPPKVVRLHFNEPVSPVAFVLVGPHGRSTTLDRATSTDQTVAIEMPASLDRGTHILSWRVISADGHPVGGAIIFSVLEVSAEAPMRTERPMDRRLQAAIWLCKLALYLGLMVGVGGSFYVAWIAGAPVPWSGRTFIVVALLCGIVGTGLSVGLQGVDLLNVPLSEIFRAQTWVAGLKTTYGTSAMVATAAFALGLCGSCTIGPRRLLAASALVGVGITLAASGHAASASPQVVMRTAVFLHGIAVAFWLGALAPLMLAMGVATARAELRRFSRAIPCAISILVASGAALSVVQLGAVDALWTTSYGLVWSAKMAAVLILLGLGAWNRFVLTPQIVDDAPGSARRLAASIRIELAIALVIMGLVAMWRFTPPPRTYQAAAASPIQIHIHTATAMADVKFSPRQAGARIATIAVWDGNFAALPAKEVTLVLTKPDAGIEARRFDAVHVGEATWRIDDLNIPMTGRWHVRVEILIDDFHKTALDDEADFR